MSTRARRKNERHPDAPFNLSDARSAVQQVMAHVVAVIDEDSHSLPDLLRVLDALSRAGTRLATLLKAERELDTALDPAAALNQALAEVLSELENRP